MHQGLVTEGDKKHIHADRSPVLIRERSVDVHLDVHLARSMHACMRRLVRRSQVMASKFGLIAETIAARTSCKWIK